MKLRVLVLLSLAFSIIAIYQNCSKQTAYTVLPNSSRQSVDSFKIDITNAPTTYTKDSDPVIAFTTLATDPLVCDLDGAIIDPCVSPQQLNNLNEGLHDFKVFLKNDPSVMNVLHWEQDSKNPSLTILNPPTAITPLKTFAINFTVVDATVTTNTCSLNDGVFEACASPIDLKNLSDGNYKLSIKSVDLSGNSQTVSTSWSIDSAAWNIKFTFALPEAFNKYTHVSFVFTAHNNAQTEYATEFQCSVDGTAYIICGNTAGPSSYVHSIADLTEGQHTFRVRAKQKNGLFTAPLSYSWTTDQTPPVITLAPQIKNYSLDGTASFVFNATDDRSGVASYTCFMSNQLTSHDCTSGVVYSQLKQNEYTFSVYAQDAAGNRSSYVSDKVQVAELVAPANDMGAREVEAKIIGNTYYLLNTKGIAIYDITTSTPALLSYMDLRPNYKSHATLTAFAVYENTLFVASDTSLFTFDITNKAKPILVNIKTSFYTTYLHISGNILFSGTDRGLLSYYIITKSTHLQLLGAVATAITAAERAKWTATSHFIVAVVGTRYLENSKLNFFDIRNPQLPKIVATENLNLDIEHTKIKANSDQLILGYTFFRSGSILPTTPYATIYAYDLSPLPAKIKLLNSLTLIGLEVADFNKTWTVAKNHFYAPQINKDTGAQVVSIFNINDSFRKVGELNFTSSFQLLTILPSADDVLHLRQGNRLDLETYKLDIPEKPTPQFSIKRLYSKSKYSSSINVTFKNTSAYVFGHKSLNVINITDTKKPLFLRAINSEIVETNYTFVSGPFLYALGYKMNGVHRIPGSIIEQFDITNPNIPVLKNRFDRTTYPSHATATTNGSFVIIEENSAVLYNLAQTSKVVLKSQITLPKRCLPTQQMRARMLYLVCGQATDLKSKLILVDTSGDTLVVKSETEIDTAKPVIHKNYLYLLNSKNIKTFLISETNTLTDKGTTDLPTGPTYPFFVAIADELIFNDGKVLDVSNPILPKYRMDYFSRYIESYQAISSVGSKIVGYGDGFDSN